MAQKKSNLDKKYILRDGQQLFYNNTHFMNEGEADEAHTLTDKIAENAIKKLPNAIGLFLTEKERKVLEAMDQGVTHVQEAEADLHNDPIMKEITVLVEDEQYENARKKALNLHGNQVVGDSLKSIDIAEEKAIEAAIKKEEADKKKAADAKKKAAEDKKKAEQEKTKDSRDKK